MSRATDSPAAIGQARFPALSPATAEWTFSLPPFEGHPEGWSGPVESFLRALRCAELPLERVPLAALAGQYLDRIASLPPGQAAEFMPVAAALIEWKTRLLLPADPALAGGAPDPREEIRAALEKGERKRKKLAFPDGEAEPELREPPVRLSLLDLMILLLDVERSGEAHSVSLAEISVERLIAWLLDRFERSGGAPADAASLLSEHPSAAGKVALFLALLELAKRGDLRLEQSEAFAPLSVRPASRHPGSALAVSIPAGGDVLS